MFALLTDITETKQLRSLQQLIMSALADEIPITDIADRLCRRVEEIAPDVVSSLLHIDAGGLIHPLGGPSLPDDYSRALDGVAIGPDIGSCGSAAYFGEAVLAMDIDTDPRWQPYKTRPLEVGLRACWSTPIKAKDGRVIGTFAFYFRECRAPSRWHQRIVDACVDLGSLAIERQEARAQIARLAYYDMLTGLPNRAHLRDLISDAIQACPAGKHVALAFLDVDNFKDVNDTLGHSAGDELLVEFAQRLRAQIQPGDMLGRLGGDEFVIVLPNRDAADASLVASRITEALAMPLRIGTRQVPMSASMGISIYPDNATDIDALMQQADAAMYKAKRAGRSTYRFFSADMNRLAEQRLAHSAALRARSPTDALKLHYQPQIRTIDGAIHGVEALARWHDPVLGEVSPAKFIPLAEECGLIEQIGMWSIREACRQMAQWRKAGLDIPCVSVNLSPINFQNANLAAAVAGILADHGLPPEVLMLEITEGVIMNERAVAIETMNSLRELGVGLSLDDFGTGYSSLSRLAHLPIRELKIDRSFMRDVERDPERAGDRHRRRPCRPEPAAHRRRRRRRNRRAAQPAGRTRLRRRPGISLRPGAVAPRVRALAARPQRRPGGRDAEAHRPVPGPPAGQGAAAGSPPRARASAFPMDRSRTQAGAVRYVAEADHRGFVKMFHIFNGDQLEPRA